MSFQIDHESYFPHLTAAKFRELWEDEGYQRALDDGAHIKRERVPADLPADSFGGSWIARGARHFGQGYLAPLRLIWPNGVRTVWQENHIYQPAAQPHTGQYMVELKKPFPAKITASISFEQRGDNLVKHCHFDLANVELPWLLRALPFSLEGMCLQALRIGLKHADETTEHWLQEHPGNNAALATAESEDDASLPVSDLTPVA